MAITELGAKGRLVIPAHARAEANLEIGQALVVTAEGEGRIVIESLDVVQARVWAAASGGGADGDSRDDVRTLRQQDVGIADNAAARRAGSGGLGDCRRPDAAGAALLAALGL